MTNTSSESNPGAVRTLAGRPVARVGYGAMQLEHGSENNAVGVLRRVVELGINHLDTAEFYGNGLVNKRIRTALYPYREDLMLVSKVGAASDPAPDREIPLRAAQRPAELRSQVEANLATLDIERLDVVNLRRMDVGPGVVAEGDQQVDFDDQLAEMEALRDEGKIGAIGLSQVSVDQVLQALPAGIVCVQNPFSLVDRTTEPVRALCQEHDLAWVPFFPLGGALPGMPKVTEQPQVRTVAERLRATPAQIGLAWHLAHDPQTLLIPGTADVDHLEQNFAAADIALDAEAITTLEQP